MTKIIDRAGKGAAINATENDANLSSLSGINAPITATTHTVDVDDQNDTIEYSNALPIAVTLPAISSVTGANIHTDDFKVTLKNIGVGLVTVTRGGTDTFDDGDTSKTLSQFESITIQSDNALTAWNIVNSHLTRYSLEIGIIADVGSAQGGSPLTKEINEISTCATIGDSVTLPAAIGGQKVTIINNGVNAADVFPASGDNLGAGVNTAVSLAAGANITYASYDATNWFVLT